MYDTTDHLQEECDVCCACDVATLERKGCCCLGSQRSRCSFRVAVQGEVENELKELRERGERPTEMVTKAGETYKVPFHAVKLSGDQEMNTTLTFTKDSTIELVEKEAV